MLLGVYPQTVLFMLNLPLLHALLSLPQDSASSARFVRYSPNNSEVKLHAVELLCSSTKITMAVNLFLQAKIMATLTSTLLVT